MPMKHCFTSSKIREKTAKALQPSEQTLIALRLFARSFNPHGFDLSLQH